MNLENTQVIENGLIPIYQNDNEENLVDARTLHAELGINEKFADWIKKQIRTLKFEQDKDFSLVSVKTETFGGATTTKDYLLTLDTAKHIAMASRTAKGKEVRNYFINFEKKAKELIKNELLRLKANNISSEEFQLVQTRRRLLEAKKQKTELDKEINSLEQEFNHILKIPTEVKKTNQLFYFLLENQNNWFTRSDFRKQNFCSKNKFHAKWFAENIKFAKEMAESRGLIIKEERFGTNGSRYMLTDKK